ncbi:hypothetical protein BCR35DRAFT_304114 [Leucosporidium creatinivorum]|uniref:Uncharacterized protein n=1 Tax=Leucosporidium creatinivorum TaxID=106004 RepID=A0A1Y2FBH4_9BASI|nr:hypothetical protein BCR35DRAFT_304114 [Leucosporidium creatinivorum]
MAQLVAPPPTHLQDSHPLDEDDLDLLHQTFDSATTRTSYSLAEDHLEDILSLPLAQELHSRRSNQKLSHTPSTSSLSSSHLDPPLPRAPPPPPSQSPSTTRRPHHPKSRSTSPELIPLSRARSRSRGASEQLGVAASGMGRTGTGKEDKGATTAMEQWETLQVASPSPTVKPRTSKAAAGASSTGMQRSRTAGSLPSSTSGVGFPSSTKAPPLPLPTTPPSADLKSAPRKRAQTSNLLTSSPPSSSAGKRALSPSTTPAPPPSFSAATSYHRESTEIDPLPPWVQEGPRVFRDRDWKEGSGEGGLRNEGRVEDMVLPAVARRLEAERLARLESEGLITHWDRDGVPMVALNGNGRAVGGGGSGRELTLGGKEEVGGGGKRTNREDQGPGDDSIPPPPPPPQQQPTTTAANADLSADRSSLPPPPQPPQKEHRPSRDLDPHGLARPLSGEVGAGVGEKQGKKSKEQRRQDDEEQKGCCAACVVM